MNNDNQSSSDITRQLLLSTQEMNTEDFLVALRGGEQKEALALAVANAQIDSALDKP